MKFNLSENVPKSVISINQNIHPLTVFLTTIVGYPHYIMNSQTHYLYMCELKYKHPRIEFKC